jgi:Ca2+-binding RTX toxin-like protein
LAGNDTITLTSQADEANGGTGDDTIAVAIAGTASHTITGGDGDDTVYIRSAAAFQGKIDLGAGADTVRIGTANTTISNGAIYGGTGSDTIVITNTITTATIGGGSGADWLHFTGGNTITSSKLHGGQGADSIDLRAAGTLTTSTVQGGKGFDTMIIGSGYTSTNSRILAGKGNDSISIGTGGLGTTSIAGGTGNDTIQIVSSLGTASSIYGDSVGVTTDGGGAIADGNDFIEGTQATQSQAGSIYGGGGSDTISLLSITGATLVDGGDGTDSIRIFSGSTAGTVQGGAGNDTITYQNTVAAATTGMGTAMVLLDGGAGIDTYKFGSGIHATFAAGTQNANSQVAMVVKYGAGDIIALDTVLATTQSNWAQGGIWSLSAAAQLGAVATIAGNLNAIGDTFAWSDGTDTWIGVNARAINSDSGFFIVEVQGKDLVTTTLFGLHALNATNFGFSITYGGDVSDAAGVSITLT